MKISPTQQSVLSRLQPGLMMVRWPGGFWTFEGCPPKNPDRPDVPEWWVETQTIRAMTEAGLLVRTHVYREEWRDERKLAEKTP